MKKILVLAFVFAVAATAIGCGSDTKATTKTVTTSPK